MKLFQINEEDLATLEHDVAEMADALSLLPPDAYRRIKSEIRRVQGVLQRMRWRYGPHDNIEIIPANGEASSA